MPPVRLRKSAESRAIEVHRKDVPLPVVSLIGDEVDGILVHRLDRLDFIVALLELPLQLRIRHKRILLVEAVEIKMRIAIPPARPQKAVARLQDAKYVIDIHPAAWAAFGENLARAPGLRVDEVQIHRILGAIQRLSPENSVAHPAKTRDVDVCVIGEVDPSGLAAFGRDYAEPHYWIGITRLGIPLLIHLGLCG